MDPRFVHLRQHTEYSLIDGVGRIRQIAARARELGMPALAITDHMNIYGAVKFYRACVDAGIKPIIGADIWCGDGEDRQLSRLILLCRDNRGYVRLCELLTRAWLSGRGGDQPGIRMEWLEEDAEGLIVLSGGMDGSLGRALLAGHDGRARTLAERFRSLLGDRFYIELSRIGAADEERYCEAAVALASVMAIPVVATNQVQFLDPQDFEAHEIRVCINEGRVLTDPRRPRRFTDHQYLRSAGEMAELFAHCPAALANTVEIARRCNVFLDFDRTYMPAYPVTEGLAVEDLLRDDARAGLDERWRRHHASGDQPIPPPQYLDRLAAELDVINGMGFAGYFLIVADFIRWARENDIPVGPGRGSGAGSLVAYAIGITELDPIRYGLLFERFLNPERVSLPDFDIDFCMEGRDRVIDYVADRYGRDQVSQIITYGTLAARAVVRDVGRVMGHPYGYVDALAKQVPFEIGMTLRKALDQDETLRERYNGEEDVGELLDKAMALEGLPRNVGKHAGGVVIAPERLTRFTALYAESGMAQPVTQFDKDDLEAIGLVKFDFLGLRTLTVIHKTVNLVNDGPPHQQRIDIASIPLDDEATYRTIRAGRTKALFQLESRGMTELIRRLLPDTFEDLIALVALFRPGPLQSGMVEDFINRKHGREPVRYPHPEIEPILEPTYGVILYQEQVMQIAQVLAGYTLGAADLLRRAMGKKKPEEMARQREVFVEGAREHGVDPRSASHIFDLMEKFAGYGFNKSHSAAYALLTYQTAWLKTHYPAEFMAASMSADMEHTDKVVALIAECRAMGIELLPPDVNTCRTEFTAGGRETIRYGLGAIKGVGSRAVQQIIAEREARGPFRDLFELCRRLDEKRFNRRLFQALIHAGALDGLGRNRASLSASLALAMELAGQHHHNRSSGQNDMFGIDGGEVLAGDAVETDEWPAAHRLAAEKETLGLYLTGHPIDPYQREFAGLVDAPIADLDPQRPGNVIVAGLVVSTRTVKTRRGDRIAVLTLDDKSGRMEVTVFTELYRRHRLKIGTDRMLLAVGSVSQDEFSGGTQMRASALFELDEVRAAFLPRLVVRIDCSASGEAAAGTIRRLEEVLAGAAPGATRIAFQVHLADGASGLLEAAARWRRRVDESLAAALRERVGDANLWFRYNTGALREWREDPSDAAA